MLSGTRRSTMRPYLVIPAGVLLACCSVHADDWALAPEVKDTEFRFGDSRIVLHYDSTQDQHYPHYALRVYLKRELVGEHEGVGFEAVFASPDNAFFVGTSNRGLIKQAYVVFDRQGRIIKAQPHDPRQVHYASMSKTLVRRWYDDENPQPTFRVVDVKLKDVWISACDGTRVSLLIREDLSLRRFLLERLLKTYAKPKENCYVCFGTEPGGKNGRPTRVDPPQRFLTGFRARAYQLKPASSYPKPEGNTPYPPNNPETGIPDGIYTVEIVEWLDQSTAEVKVSMYRDGLWASGEKLTVEKRDGAWRIKERGEAWRS
jgi:hypothetical protein